MLSTDKVLKDLVYDKKNQDSDDEELEQIDVKNLEEYKELDQKVMDFNGQMENLQKQFETGMDLLDGEKALKPSDIQKVMQMSSSKIKAE